MENHKLGGEREQTDESLRVEREKSERAASHVAELQEDVHTDERSSTLLERAWADAEVEVARGKADEALAPNDPAAPAPHVVARERARDDEALRRKRASADDALDQRHEESARAIAKLLTLERARTDRDLLTERSRRDEALANRDDFLGIVSHDLKNLITGIVMTAEYTSMQTSDVDPWKSAIAGANLIQRYASRMHRLVRDLQDIASINSGKLAIQPTRGDTTVLVTEVVDSFRLDAAAKGITLACELTDAALADFDRERMLQVLSNLLSNALKFTAQGGTVRVTRTRDGALLRFAVEDSGSGIAAEDLELVFERFWQVGKNDRRGFGLGLYIAKSIVEQHGGTIWAESEEGVGTEIVFTLPAV